MDEVDEQDTWTCTCGHDQEWHTHWGGESFGPCLVVACGCKTFQTIPEKETT